MINRIKFESQTSRLANRGELRVNYDLTHTSKYQPITIICLTFLNLPKQLYLRH